MVDIVDPYDKPSGGIIDPGDKSSKDSYTLPEDDTSAIKAFGKSAAESAVKSVVSMPGMIAGAKAAAAMVPPVAPVVGPFAKPIAAVAGGLAGGIAAGAAYDKIKDFASEYVPQELAEFIGLDKATRQRERQQHPDASFAGDLAGGMAVFRPGAIKPIELAGGKQLEAWQQRVGMGALGMGQETVSQAVNDAPWQPSHIAAAALSGAVNAKPTKITKAVGGIFEPHVKTEDPGHGEWTTLKEGSESRGGIWETSQAGSKEVPETVYHGTRTPTKKLIDKDGNLVLNPSKNFGGKTTSVSFSHDPNVSEDYSSRMKGGGPDGFTFEGAKVIKIDSKVLKELSHENEEEWAINTDKPVVIPKGSFEIVDHPLSKEKFPHSEFMDWAYETYGEYNTETKIGNGEEGQMRKQFLEEQSDEEAFGKESADKAKQWLSSIDKINSVRKQREEGTYKWPEPKMIPATKDSQPTKPNVDIPATPVDKKGLDDGLFTLHKAKQADQVIGEKRMQAASDEGVTPEMREKWGKALEGEATLTPEEQKLWDKYGAPETAERKLLTEEIQKEGFVPPTNLEEDVTGKNVARIGIPKPRGFWEKLFGGDQGGLDPNVAKAPGAAMERGYFVLEKSNGVRTVIQATQHGVTAWQNKKASFLGSKTEAFDGTIKAGDSFADGMIKEATRSEIEKHTHMQYVKDQQAVQYQKLIELRDFYRTNMFLKNLRESPYFKGDPKAIQTIEVDPNDPKSMAAAKIKLKEQQAALQGIAHKVVPGRENEIPEGFRAPEHLDKLPQFHGYVFEPRAAAIIEDFAKTWEPNALTWISSALIKNMMLNPYPHMNNEAWHWYLARGLSGWTTPKGIRSFANTFPKAMSEVMNQGPEMRDMMRNGASMLSTTTRTNAVHDAIFQKGVAEIKKNPAWHDNIVKIAEAVGKPVEAVYSGISKASSKAMWMVRDTMYMQMILEKESKGMDRKSAITEVERHMPSYRIPTHVGEGVLGEKLSRGLSKTLQNPNISIFSRYHHGMVKSQLETLKDVMAIKKGTAGFEEFKQGVDTMAAAAVAVAILYPALDLLAQAITGNKDAEQRRAGPFHVWDAMFKTAKGEKDAFSIAAGVFTFNPALLAIVQLMINQELYSGQHIWHTQDSGKQIAKDIGGYAAKQVPQVSTTLRVNSDRGGGMPQFLAQQADIKAPSKAAVEALKKRMHKEDVAAKKREQKRRAKENSD